MINFVPGKEYEIRDNQGVWVRKRFACYLNLTTDFPPKLLFVGLSRQGREFFEEHPHSLGYVDAYIREPKRSVKFHHFLVIVEPLIKAPLVVTYSVITLTKEDAEKKLIGLGFNILDYKEIEYIIDEESN